jgi:large subunit ribosomal protein L27
MATKKAAGTAKNLRDSKPKYLGVKLNHGQATKKGAIIVRQRGTSYLAGKNVGIGRDHTLFALTEGTVKFAETRKIRFDSREQTHKIVHVEAN